MLLYEHTKSEGGSYPWLILNIIIYIGSKFHKKFSLKLVKEKLLVVVAESFFITHK